MVANLRAQKDKKQAKAMERGVAKARTKDSMKAFAKLTHVVDGEPRIISDPPLIVPIAELAEEAGLDPDEITAGVLELYRGYRRTLQPDRKRLLEEFRYVDLARKVVGVGSVGTRCWILLLLGRDDGDPLFLQVKETGPSVLEPLLGRSQFRNHGQRVVEGQRLMQAASDIFLGWIRNKAGWTAGSATSMSGSSGTGRRRSTSKRSSPVASSSTHRLAAGRSRGRTPARETASQSRRTSARATPSIELLPTSPWRTPTRTNAITQPLSKL